MAGREAGSQHRDALYAVFRLKPRRIQVPNPNFDLRRPTHPENGRMLSIYETQTTWRELVTTLGLSEHPNNLLTLLTVYEELQTVVIRVQEGDPAKIQEANRRGMLGGAGVQGNIINSISWDGVNLDSRVTVRYGEWVREMIEKTRLVSLNAEVQFALSSDHAKSFWPISTAWRAIATLKRVCSPRSPAAIFGVTTRPAQPAHSSARTAARRLQTW